MKGAEEWIAREEYRRAEASLGIAMQLAEGMKLPTAPIQARYDSLQAIKEGKTVQTAAQVPMSVAVPTLQTPKLPAIEAPSR